MDRFEYRELRTDIFAYHIISATADLSVPVESRDMFLSAGK